MRNDMAKKIVERPRAGMGLKRPKKAKIKPDEEIYHERMCGKTPMQFRKNFNDNLNPLYRYLKSQCGRPWDKVYSEIVKDGKLDSFHGKHFLEHVQDYVLSSGVLRRWRSTSFHVDECGILRKTKERYRKRRMKDRLPDLQEDFAYQVKGGVVMLHNGCWFSCKEGTVKDTKQIRNYKVSDYSKPNYWITSTINKLAWIRHRQLNKKELKLYGLAKR